VVEDFYSGIGLRDEFFRRQVKSVSLEGSAGLKHKVPVDESFFGMFLDNKFLSVFHKGIYYNNGFQKYISWERILF